MGIFDSLGSKGQNGASQQQQIDPRQMMQQLQANPAAMLKQAGLTIPGGMKDPQQIINHLLQSGQIPQAKYQQAVQMLSRFRR